MRKCRNCQGELLSRRDSHEYRESGLSNVMLADVVVRQCTTCGAESVSIPAIEDLHRLLATVIASDSRVLEPEQIRFLRKWLGWSTADFADKFGVDAGQVRVWETQPHTMPTKDQVYLRTLVCSESPIDDYKSNDLVTSSIRKDEAPRVIRLERDSDGWHNAGNGAAALC